MPSGRVLFRFLGPNSGRGAKVTHGVESVVARMRVEDAAESAPKPDALQLEDSVVRELSSTRRLCDSLSDVGDTDESDSMDDSGDGDGGCDSVPAPGVICTRGSVETRMLRGRDRLELELDDTALPLPPTDAERRARGSRTVSIEPSDPPEETGKGVEFWS